MDVLVCIKRVAATGGRITLTDDERAIDTKSLGFTMSPHEECAVEEAVRLTEAHGGSSVVLALGSADSEEQVRDAMALGVDRGILLETEERFDAGATAEAIAVAIVEQETPFDLLMFGNEAADTADFQVGIRVSRALDLPVVTGVKRIEIVDGRMTAWREGSDGMEVYEVDLPAVVTVREGINVPRYPSIPGRIKAKKKEIVRLAVEPGTRTVETVRLVLPPQKASQVQVLGEGAAAAPAVVDLLAELKLVDA